VREPSLRVRQVAKLPFALFASEAYVARRGKPGGDGDLTGHDAILYAGELATLPEAKWLQSRGAHIVLRTSSLTAMLAATASGAGVAILSGRLGARELGLVRLADVPAVPPRRLFLVMHPDAATRPPVRAVAEHVAAILRDG